MKKKICLGVVIVSLIVGILVYRHVRQPGGFAHDAQRMLSRMSILHGQAATFSQQTALSRMPVSAWNGFFVRLDDSLPRATFDRLAAVSSPSSGPYVLDLEFEKDESAAFFTSDKEAFSVTDGCLRIGPTRRGFLESSGAMDLPARGISRLVIQAKSAKDSLMWLGFSADPGADLNDRIRTLMINIDLIPDGHFHQYVIPVKDLFRSKGMISRIRKIFIVPAPNVAGDLVTIDFLRLIDARFEYAQEQFGVTYEKAADNLRQAIFMTTPSRLTYRLVLPAGPCQMRFATKILEDDSLVSFSVQIGRPDQMEEIFFRQTNRSLTPWDEARLDLSKFSGQAVDLVLEATGANDNIAFWANPVVYSPAPRPMNIAIIVEDALRADHLSCYGYHRQTTPEKDRWGRSGALFLNAFAQATVTSPSVRSLMTSLYPTAMGVWGYGQLSENYLTLAEILRHQGFATASFIQNANAGVAAGLHQGFDEVFDMIAGNARQIYAEKAPDWIGRHPDRNFFIYLHLIDPHGVYDPPPEFRQWYCPPVPGEALLAKHPFFDPSWLERPTAAGRRALYDGEIRLNDYYFKKFLDRLESLGRLENTLIFFVSDHGEHLGERPDPPPANQGNAWGHHPPGYVQAIKTPMIAVGPGIPVNTEISRPVQNLDIMPTILDLLNIDRTGLILQGRSLLPLLKGEMPADHDEGIVLSEEVVNRKSKDDLRPLGSIVLDPTHVLNSPDTGLRQFDYKKDPMETCGQPVLGRDAAAYLDFLTRIQRLNADIGAAVRNNAAVDVVWADRDTIDRLRQLGYLQGGGQTPAVPSPPAPSEKAPGPADRFYDNLRRHLRLAEATDRTAAIPTYHRLRSDLEAIYRSLPPAEQTDFYERLLNRPIAETTAFLLAGDREALLNQGDPAGETPERRFLKRLQNHLLASEKSAEAAQRRYNAIIKRNDRLIREIPAPCRAFLSEAMDQIAIDEAVTILETYETDRIREMVMIFCPAGAGD